MAALTQVGLSAHPNLCSGCCALLNALQNVTVHDGSLFGGRGFYSGLSMLSRVYNQTFCYLLKWGTCPPTPPWPFMLALYASYEMDWLPAKYWSFAQTPVRRGGKPSNLDFLSPEMDGLTTQYQLSSVRLWAGELFLCPLVPFLIEKSARVILHSSQSLRPCVPSISVDVTVVSPPLSQPF